MLDVVTGAGVKTLLDKQCDQQDMLLFILSYFYLIRVWGVFFPPYLQQDTLLTELSSWQRSYRPRPPTPLADDSETSRRWRGSFFPVSPLSVGQFLQAVPLGLGGLLHLGLQLFLPPGDLLLLQHDLLTALHHQDLHLLLLDALLRLCNLPATARPLSAAARLAVRSHHLIQFEGDESLQGDMVGQRVDAAAVVGEYMQADTIFIWFGG